MDRNCESIQVDSRNVGRIIGSRGSKIREMQDISMARIQVSREEAVDGQTSVEISGTEEQIAKAKLLIEECQSSDYRGGSGYSSRGGYGGGGGRGGRRDYGGEGRDSWRDRRSYGQDDRGDSRRGYGGDQHGGRNGYDRSEGWGGRSSGSDRSSGWGGASRQNDRYDRSREDRY